MEHFSGVRYHEVLQMPIADPQEISCHRISSIGQQEIVLDFLLLCRVIRKLHQVVVHIFFMLVPDILNCFRRNKLNYPVLFRASKHLVACKFQIQIDIFE